jgi:protein phosphatase
LRIGSLTDVGKVRSSNEDAYGLALDHGVFIVADGMGGHQAGEVASQQAVDSLLESLCNREPEESAAEAMRRAVADANTQIAAAAQKDRNLKGMGTTVVGAIVEGNRFTVAHVGDSRAYLVRDRAIKQLTEDHSMVAELVKAGVITPEAAETHPYRSAISRSLGQFKEVETDTIEMEFAPGDQLLLCTDGLTRFAKAEEILERILANDDPQDAAQALIDLANERGGRDNITAILISNS